MRAGAAASRLPNSQPRDDDLRASRWSASRSLRCASRSTIVSWAASRSMSPAATSATYRAEMELIMWALNCQIWGTVGREDERARYKGAASPATGFFEQLARERYCSTFYAASGYSASI